MRGFAFLVGAAVLLTGVGTAAADNGRGGSRNDDSNRYSNSGQGNRSANYRRDDREDREEHAENGKKHCRDDDDAIRMIKWSYGSREDDDDHGWSKEEECPRPPVSPPGHGAGNPGNAKPVGKAGDKDDDGVRGNSQHSASWNPRPSNQARRGRD